MASSKATLRILPALSTAVVLPDNLTEMPMPEMDDALVEVRRQNARLEETLRGVFGALNQATSLIGDLTKQYPALDRRYILGELVSIKNDITAARKLLHSADSA